MIWKKINILDCHYSVSDCGKVRSDERIIKRSNGILHKVRERILKPAKDSNGYMRVSLTINKKSKTYKVHRLVASEFCPMYIGKNEVNHINGIKDDNRSENLEWVNRSENVKHSFKTGLAKSRKGSRNTSAKIDEITALTIKTFIKSGWKLINISKEMKVSYNIIKDISRNKTWKHISV